jgi:hypothetical protein
MFGARAEVPEAFYCFMGLVDGIPEDGCCPFMNERGMMLTARRLCRDYDC